MHTVQTGKAGHESQKNQDEDHAKPHPHPAAYDQRKPGEDLAVRWQEADEQYGQRPRHWPTRGKCLRAGACLIAYLLHHLKRNEIPHNINYFVR